MKHLFVINPSAGKKDSTVSIMEKIEQAFTKEEAATYITKGNKDATVFVKQYLKDHPEPVRIYACGGDGTLNEVTTGAYGFKQAEIVCYPSGSGNDFIKAFGAAEDFLDLSVMKLGKSILVDVLKLNGRLSINICNLGFDALVGFKFSRFKKWPLISGKGAYNLSVMASLFSPLGYPLTIKIDGEQMFDGSALLCAIANGICYGGGYYCAPDALVDDGLANICVVKKVSRLTFIRLIKYYKAGTHINNPKLAPFLDYRQGKKITISSKKPFYYTLDGEMLSGTDLEVEVIAKQIRFVLPKQITSQKKYKSAVE